MSESRVHVAMDGHSYMEFFEDHDSPGKLRALFHPEFAEQGVPLVTPEAACPAEPNSRLARLLRQAIGQWQEDDRQAPLSEAF